jgi:hypothetical protein
MMERVVLSCSAVTARHSISLSLSRSTPLPSLKIRGEGCVLGEGAGHGWLA